jgi:hypothetical protein
MPSGGVPPVSMRHGRRPTSNITSYPVTLHGKFGQIEPALLAAFTSNPGSANRSRAHKYTDGGARDLQNEAIAASFVLSTWGALRRWVEERHLTGRMSSPIAPDQTEPELLVRWYAAVKVDLAEKITRMGKPLGRCMSPT